MRYVNSGTRRAGTAEGLLSVDGLHKAFVDSHVGQSWRGAKWNFAQFAMFRATIGSEGSHRDFADWFPRPAFIRLARRSIIDQAVSMYVAKLTSRWSSHDIIPASAPVAYDFNAIWSEFADFAAEEALWAQHFSRLDAPQVSVVYEDLISDYGGVMRRILSAIDPEAIDRVGDGDPLPADVKNQKIADPALAEFAARFEKDLTDSRHKQAGGADILNHLVDAYTNRASETPIFRLLGNHSGRHPRLRKLNLSKDVKLGGLNVVVEGAHFLDRSAIRLDANATAKLTVNARGVLIEFLSHPWSGRVQVSAGDTVETLDLYGAITTARPVLIERPRTQPVTITITALGQKSAIAEGVEVWLQRIWVVED